MTTAVSAETPLQNIFPPPSQSIQVAASSSNTPPPVRPAPQTPGQLLPTGEQVKEYFSGVAKPASSMCPVLPPGLLICLCRP